MVEKVFLFIIIICSDNYINNPILIIKVYGLKLNNAEKVERLFFQKNFKKKRRDFDDDF